MWAQTVSGVGRGGRSEERPGVSPGLGKALLWLLQPRPNVVSAASAAPRLCITWSTSTSSAGFIWMVTGVPAATQEKLYAWTRLRSANRGAGQPFGRVCGRTPDRRPRHIRVNGRPRLTLSPERLSPQGGRTAFLTPEVILISLAPTASAVPTWLQFWLQLAAFAVVPQHPRSNQPTGTSSGL